MIEEKTAVEIATRFLKSRGVHDDEFSEANYLQNKNAWSCLFLRKMSAEYVDSPGMTIVVVDCSTAEPSFFDVM